MFRMRIVRLLCRKASLFLLSLRYLLFVALWLGSFLELVEFSGVWPIMVGSFSLYPMSFERFSDPACVELVGCWWCRRGSNGVLSFRDSHMSNA